MNDFDMRQEMRKRGRILYDCKHAQVFDKVTCPIDKRIRLSCERVMIGVTPARCADCPSYDCTGEGID